MQKSLCRNAFQKENQLICALVFPTSELGPTPTEGREGKKTLERLEGRGKKRGRKEGRKEKHQVKLLLAKVGDARSCMRLWAVATI